MPCRVFATAGAGTLICLVAACAPPEPRLENAPPTVTSDAFSKFIEIKGPSMKVGAWLGYTAFYNLFTDVDKQTHRYTHLIGVDVIYDRANQIGYRYAADDTAQPLRLIPVVHTRSRVCKDCSREEIFNIAVSDAALRSHAASGYQVKASSILGDYLIIDITPPMIAAQYVALQKVIGPEAAGAATPPAQRPEREQPQAKAKPPPLGLAFDADSGLQMMSQSAADMTHGAMHGAVVLAIVPGSPAETAGIRSGDLIVKFDGKPVGSGNDVLDIIAKANPRSVVKVDISRGPTHVTVHLKL